MPKYKIVYDSKCNLCSTFAQLLKQFDREQTFSYIPMQDRSGLAAYGITPDDCEAGMILIDTQNPASQWQGSEAAEEIANLLPLGETFVAAYRGIPGMKWLGDRSYEQIRDHRYEWFGERKNSEPI
ncbi:MAG: DCC1-like thiol-disulfide oxidoreductase family protein [Cyanobacteria bacterium J06600_6]